MSNEQEQANNESPSSNAVGSSHLSVGVQLKQQREQKKLTVEQIAADLHLAVHVINDLEQDKIDKFGSTYAKGYIRGYAAILGLDADQLIVQFEQAHGQQEHNPFYKTHIEKEREAATSSAKASKQELLKNLKLSNMKLTPKAKVRYMTYAVLIILIGLMVAWWDNHYEQNPTANQRPLVSHKVEHVYTEPQSQYADQQKSANNDQQNNADKRNLTAKLNMDSY